MKKKLVRENILEKRSKIPANKRETDSQNIINKILDSDYYKEASTIMVFVSFSDEVNTHNFIKQAIKDGKNIVVPITFPETHELKPSLVKDFNELKPGYYDILTPPKEVRRYRDPEEIDLVITPGVAFRKDGYRVGYGGGYYDRFLSKIPETPKIAIAFSVQLVEDLPVDHYDIPVDYIYTEDEIINSKKFR